MEILEIMKDLTIEIEEKAKRYDEAIKRIENIKTGKCETIFMFTEGLFEYIFSELKESGNIEKRLEMRNNALMKCLQDSNAQIGVLIEENFKLREELKKQKELKPNPYSGTSFEYNGHIWGMCARDNGVDIMLDKQLFKHLDEKQGEQKMKTEPKDVIDVPLIDIPFGAKDSELIGATYFIPKGFHAEIEDDKVIFKKGEQKSVWSEEDERIRGAICDTLDRIDEHIMKCHQRLTHQQVKDWLKSLKERIKK